MSGNITIKCVTIFLTDSTDFLIQTI